VKDWRRRDDLRVWHPRNVVTDLIAVACLLGSGPVGYLFIRLLP
jgi:hypothetical protein